MTKPTIIDTSPESFIIIDHHDFGGTTEFVRGVCTRGLSDDEIRRACHKSEPTISGLPRVARFPIVTGVGHLDRVEAFQVSAYTGD